MAESTNRMQNERKVRMAEMERERFDRMRVERAYALQQQQDLAEQRRKVKILINYGSSIKMNCFTSVLFLFVRIFTSIYYSIQYDRINFNELI